MSRGKFFAFLVIFILFFGGLGYWLTRMVKINNIFCFSQYGPCSENLAKKLDGIEGGRFFDVRSQITKQLSSDPQVSSFSLKFQIPDIYKVNVIEKKPAVAYKLPSMAKYRLLDKDGNIVGEEEDVRLPVLLVADEDTSFDKIVFSAKLTEDLYSLYGVKEVRLRDRGLEARIGEILIIFPLEGDRDVLMGSLQLVLSQLNSGSEDFRIEEALGSKPKVVDFRYKNPIVR